jgi:hypothetical protein
VKISRTEYQQNAGIGLRGIYDLMHSNLYYASVWPKMGTAQQISVKIPSVEF